jgi:putative FmdB family regulatory protein
MPTYQYQCTKCDLVFEKVQSFNDEPWKDCIECKSPVRKLFNNVGVVFKGSGFYKTDSRKKPESKTKGESKSESKSEHKPETKTDNKSAGTETKSKPKPTSKSD